jgi:hypothetical protein
MNEYGALVEWYGQGKAEEKFSPIKPCSNASFSTANPAQTGVGLNRDFQVGNLAFNRLRQGTALKERDRLHVMRGS